MLVGQNTNKKMKKNIRDVLIEKENGLNCHYCKKTIVDEFPSVDHKIPTSKGGTNCIDNLVLCCRSCNSKKGQLTYSEYLQLVAIRKKLPSKVLFFYMDENKITIKIKKGVRLKDVAEIIDKET